MPVPPEEGERRRLSPFSLMGPVRNQVVSATKACHRGESIVGVVGGGFRLRLRALRGWGRLCCTVYLLKSGVLDRPVPEWLRCVRRG